MSQPPTAEELTELFRSTEQGEIELRETHISQVFLTQCFAYKRKKPVEFDFLDYSTLEKREHQCEAEVELNRRLAKDVYVGVVAVTQEANGQFALAGDGEPVECLVKMQRLPDDQRLKSRLEAQQATRENVQAIADTLAKFYETAERPPLLPSQYTDDVWQRIVANHHELSANEHQLPSDVVNCLFRGQSRWMALQRELLQQRAADGRIVDGHGDLRADHVYLTPLPIVIDCIEFNKDFRRIDTADELAFLAMECDALGAAWVGDELFRAYTAASGDEPPPPLIALYKCFRACVRAKVAAIREEQTAGKDRESNRQEAIHLLQLAESYLPAMRTSSLLLVSGISGSGKSTVASALAEAMPASHLQTDRLRKQIESNLGSVHRYSAAGRQAVYDEMFRRAGEHLAHGEAVLLDGTFLDQQNRDRCRQLASDYDVPWLAVFCECPAEVAKQRIRERDAKHPSEAYVDLIDGQMRSREMTAESAEAIRLDTTADIAENVDMVMRRWRDRMSL